MEELMVPVSLRHAWQRDSSTTACGLDVTDWHCWDFPYAPDPPPNDQRDAPCAACSAVVKASAESSSPQTDPPAEMLTPGWQLASVTSGAGLTTGVWTKDGTTVTATAADGFVVYAETHDADGYDDSEGYAAVGVGRRAGGPKDPTPKMSQDQLSGMVSATFGMSQAEADAWVESLKETGSDAGPDAPSSG
ncbi:hypothetical protein GCM10023317_40570 [Actinopolymorpha pittospori]